MASTGIFSANNNLSHFLQINSFVAEATKQFDSALDTTVLSELYLDTLNMMYWDLGKSGLWQHVHMQWFVYLGFCVKWGDVMCNSIDCVMSLLFITTTFSLCSTSFEFTLLNWPCCNFVWHGSHMNSFSLLCTYLIMHQQHLGCPKYSSLSQILHNHVTFSVFCYNMHKHTHSSWIHQVFSFSFHHHQCLYQNESGWPVKSIISPHIFL